MTWDKMNTMCKWEQTKAMFIVNCLDDLGIDYSGYGEIGLNENTGNVYVWLDGYSFTLYMPIICDLKKEHVRVLFFAPYDGAITEKSLGEFSTLEEIEAWIETVEKNQVRGTI